MFKIQKIIAVLLVLVMVVAMPLTAFASGVSSNTEFTVNYPEPTCNENQGYFSVVYATGNYSEYCLWTYFWNIQDQTEFDSSVSMKITFDNQILTFQPDVFGDHYAGVTLANYTYDEKLNVCYTNSLYSTSAGAIYTDNYTGFNIVGILYGGNVTLGTTLQGFSVPIVHFSNDVSAIQLNQKLNEVISGLGKIEGDTTDMVEKLESIYNQNVAITQKLEDIEVLLQEIKAELEKQTTWLEKIYNLINEAPEKEKQEAQTQGEQSTSDVSNSVEDKSGNFQGSVDKLVGAMSYTGTDSTWTFPALYLPAIEGVMPRYQLTEEKPIDFEYWVNQIPSSILSLVRYLLTMALIVYCFKEFYGLISYVLTLRGGNVNE